MRLWALCTPLSPSSAYAPLSPAPLPPRHAFFLLSRVIFSLSLWKKRTYGDSHVSLMGANFFSFFFLLLLLLFPIGFLVNDCEWSFFENFLDLEISCIPIDRSSSFAATFEREKSVF